MTIGKMQPDNLIAGNYPIVVVPVSVFGADATELKRGDVVALVGGAAVLVDSQSASDEGKLPCGIMCEDVSTEADEQKVATMYVKGEFNIRAMRFGGDDTADTHRRRMTEIGIIPRETRI